MCQSAAEGGNGNAANEEPAAGTKDKLKDMRKYLLLIAILAATVTYVAGLNPPGGVWLDTQDGHLTGNQILVVTYHKRYNAFSYSNATAFMASAVVTLLLLLLEVKEERLRRLLLVALRVVMSLDMLALVIAYAAGASRDMVTTVLASVLVFPIFIYVLLHTLMDSKGLLGLTKSLEDCPPTPEERTENEKRRKILVLLAIFATTVTYTAGLNPPGGFWPVTEEGHRAGDPVLPDHHRHRFVAFFICNTASFVASLSVNMLLFTRQFNKKFLNPRVANGVPYVFMVISLLGLVGAYAAGSCRETRCTTGVPVLYMVGLALVYLAWLWLQDWPYTLLNDLVVTGAGAGTGTAKRTKAKLIKIILAGLALNFAGLKKARALLLLLATLAATVTYQAGLNPPGGFWPDDRDGHKGGDPIMLSKHAMRYRVFFYCNSMALAASLVVIFMVLRNFLDNISTKHIKPLVALVTVMILDLISLIGAFAAGCGRDVSTSIYAVALAGGTLVYVVFHMVFFTLHRHDNLHEGDDAVEKKRKRLLLLAILVATLTYQAGLTPPGGFWLMDGEPGHHAGDPVLLSNYPRRYAAFFYLNATGFMASVALTILLVNQNLYRAAINCHALYVCMVAGLFGLMGAYAAGSSRHVRTSMYMIALIGGAVITFVTILLLLKSSEDEVDQVPDAVITLEKGDRGTVNNAATASLPPSTEGGNTSSTETTDNITQRKYLMLLGILAASVSYQAGLAPPGGVWPDNSDGHAVGNPILRDSNHRRYHIFFYCNSTSFVASMVVITLQLLVELINGRLLPEYVAEKFLIQAAQWAMVVDLIGLLGAYAAGSSREWETSGYIVALVAAVASYIGVHLIVSFLHRKYAGDDNKNNDVIHTSDADAI